MRNNDYAIASYKKIILLVVGVFTSSLIARYLGPDLRGNYAYILNSVAIGAVLLNAGVNINFQSSRLAEGTSVVKYYFSYSIYLFSILLGAFFIYYLLTKEVSENTLIFILVVSSLARMQLGQYTIVENFYFSSLAAILSSIFELIALILVYYYVPESLIIATIVLLIKNTISIVMSIYILKFKCNIGFVNTSDHKKITTKVFSKGIKPYILTILVEINYKIDILILIWMGVDAKYVGLFAIGSLLAGYVLIVADVFKEIQIKRTARGGGASDVAFSTRISSFIIIIIIAVFLFTGELAIRILYGKEFLDAFYIAILMFIASYFMIYCKIIGVYYISKGKYDFYIKIFCISTFLNILSNVLLIPIIGVDGSILASIISYSFAGIVFIIDFSKTSNIPIKKVIVPSIEEIKSLKNLLINHSR